MSHLKKDFKFHNYFDNKFSEQTYLAYLCRGKKDMLSEVVIIYQDL